MASPAWDVEPLEIFDARQALRIGAYSLAQAAIGRLSKALAAAADTILIQIEICNAKGDYLTLDKFVTPLLDDKIKRPRAMTELLLLVKAHCRMMMDMAMSDYIKAGLDTWRHFLQEVDLKSCDKTTLFLEAEFHRGMHACIHFIYNAKKASERPRDTNFGVESLDDYPLPLLRQDAAVRLTTVIRRLLDYNDPHAALGIYTVLIGWYSPDEVDSQELLEKILNHGVPDSLLTARIYIQHATATAKRDTFAIAKTLLTEAKSAVAFLGPSEYANEIRLIEAKMGFIAIGSLGILSGPLGSAVLEGEYVSMIQEFLLAGHYSLAANAVTQYMACIDYIPQPAHVNEILDLAELIGVTSGNNAYLWTVRLIALGSAPLQGQIALGHRSVWCQTYLNNYAETGAWEISRRYALHYSLYYHKIGDVNQQLEWAMAAADFDARITNDPYERLSSMHQTFMIMVRRLNLLPEDEHNGFELEDVQQFGIEGFEACEEAGFKDLALSFVDHLAKVGIVPEKLFGASQGNLPPVLTPLGEPENLDANELLTLYIKQRNLLDRCLDYNCVEQSFEVIEQFNAYIDPILDVLRHGTDLNLRAADYAMVQNAMLVRLARGILRIDSATYDQQTQAFAVAQAAADQCEKNGDLDTRHEALHVAAQWAFRLKAPNWGKVVMDLLRQADDCMDATRKYVTAVSRIDSLDQKQKLVASAQRSEVYIFGYMAMSALMDSTDNLAVLNAEDRVSANDVWAWMQRGKGRSVLDLIRAGENPQPPPMPSATTQFPSVDTARVAAADDKSLTAKIYIGLALEDVQSMAADYAKSEQGSSMITVDWFITSSHIDMIVVDAAGEVHVETLDFTIETAMSYLMRKPVKLRGSDDVRAWRDAYLGQAEFLSDVLTSEALSELDWLVEPLEKHSKAGDLLVFCPSSFLHGIPLHAIPLAGQTLIERNPIVYTSSLSLMRNCCEMATKRETAASKSAVFGVFGKSGQKGLLRSAEEQKVEAALESISSLLDAKVEYGISPGGFIEKCIGQHIIHYHGHAILGKTKESRFGQSLVLATASNESDLLQWDDAIDDSLLLGEGDDDALGRANTSARLSARDMITRLKLSSAHVTLIACNSATQEFSAGDEPQGIIPVLLLCGATSVLGTLWPILSSDGRKFSESFYTAFGKPRSVVNLARAVQQSVLDMKAKQPAPIHWAGFVLHGAWFHRC
ncbi:hypothetical protein PWT90_06810 [Aphanocladium album]|nr:hypothetical protein PWT90_06810 [Aphanocladium album]